MTVIEEDKSQIRVVETYNTKESIQNIYIFLQNNLKTKATNERKANISVLHKLLKAVKLRRNV